MKHDSVFIYKLKKHEHRYNKIWLQIPDPTLHKFHRKTNKLKLKNSYQDIQQFVVMPDVSSEVKTGTPLRSGDQTRTDSPAL